MKKLPEGAWQPYRTGMETWQVRCEDIRFACQQQGLPTSDTGFFYPAAGPLRERFFHALEHAPRVTPDEEKADTAS